jgi:predicted permease
MTAPRVARAVVAMLAPPGVRADLIADLDEALAGQVQRRGPLRARWWYYRQVLTGIPSLVRLRRRGRSDRKWESADMTGFDAIGQNIRHAARFLVKSPGFTLAAVLTLGLGVGANAAIFTLVKAVILQPLPYADPGRLLIIWKASDPGDVTHLSIREILGYREGASLERLGAYMDATANLTGGLEAERVRSALVTPELFETLGVAPMLGRTFDAAEGAPGGASVVVLGHGLWQRRFGGAADIVGRSIQVNGVPRTVVGVMPAGFRLPVDYRVDRASELWTPLVIDPARLEQWGSRSYFGIGRLRPGVAPDAATSEFKVISDRWIQAGFVRDNGDGGLVRAALPLQDFVTGSIRRPLLILFAAVGVVLLIACANVVNLLLAKADVRRKEVAIRAALGAGRGQIVQQLLAESILLSLAGGVIAVAIGQASIRTLIVMQPGSLPRAGEASIDAGVLAFTAVLALATGVLFGLVPAIHLSRPDTSAVLHETGRGGTATRARLAVRQGLVVLQLASSVVLVVLAGLVVRSLVELNRIDLGFNPRNLLTAQIQLPPTDYPQTTDVNEFFRQALDRLGELPGVTSAGAVRILPLSRSIGNWSITIEGRPMASPNENPNGDFQFATPGYFAAMGTTLVRGRFLTADDREDTTAVVIINDTMAARYWPGQDAVGRRFRMGGPGGTTPFMTIVGIVKTSRHNAVVEEPRAEMYLPHTQLAQSVGSPGRGMALVLKTEGDPLAQAGALREVVRSLNPNLPVADIRPMEAVAAGALAGPRFATLLLSVFALLALTLASIGIYGTISLLVAERAHEIGIRMALGAGKDVILTWILTHGLTMAAAGIVIGLTAAFFVTRLLGTLIYGIGALDPLTFTAAPALLAAVALLASLVPARRAAALDPVATLRQ